MKVGEKLRTLGFDFDPHGSMDEPPPSLRDRLRVAKRRLTGLWRHPASAADVNRVYHASEL
jgi:hypothetical protein